MSSTLHERLLTRCDPQWWGLGEERARWLNALRAVVELHKPEPYSQRQANRWFVCAGCDIDGYEAEYPEWPCSTIKTIARELGVEIGETTP